MIMRGRAKRHADLGSSLIVGLVSALVLAACTSSVGRPANNGSGGSSAGGGGGGVNGAAGQDAAAAGSVGPNGGSGGGGGGGVIVPDASDMSDGPSGEPSADLVAEVPSAPCPGAGKSLHFQDDLNGQRTTSVQVLADLGNDVPIGNSARTVEMWAYFEGNESWKSEHSIVEYGGTGRCQAFGIDGGDNAMRDPIQFDPFTFSSGGPCTGDNNNTTTPQPPRTGWLHLAWVYDPTGGLSYNGMSNLNFLFTVNGVPQNIPDKKQTGSLLTMKTPVSIGSGQITNDGFTGKIDEFRMWNVARSAQDIADNYKLILTGDEPGLVVYYHFDDGSGTAPKDSSSKHHDAMFASGHPAPTWVDSTDLVLTCKQ